MNIYEGKGKEDETLIFMGYTNLTALSLTSNYLGTNSVIVKRVDCIYS